LGAKEDIDISKKRCKTKVFL